MEHLEDRRGRAVPFDEAFDGPYTLMYVGASWCGPCEALVPHIVDYYRDFERKDLLDFVHVSRDDDPGARSRYVRRQRMPGVVVWLGERGTSELDTWLKLGGIPQVLVLDRDDNVIMNSEDYAEKGVTTGVWDMLRHLDQVMDYQARKVPAP